MGDRAAVPDPDERVANGGSLDGSTLYVVATPIGNLDDISIRALRVLTEVDVIACEDTRHTRKLLTHFEITGKRLIACHDHNEQRSAGGIVNLLDQGRSVALCSDAGTPLVNDPGYRVVSAVRDAGFDVTAIPGASAVTAALVVSGLPTDRFFFAGFPPRKPGRRRRWLADLRVHGCTVVLLESANRLPALLADALDVLGDIDAAVCLELTKRFEETTVGPLSELIERFPDAPRGEVTVVLDLASSTGAEQTGDGPSSASSTDEHPEWPPLTR